MTVTVTPRSLLFAATAAFGAYCGAAVQNYVWNQRLALAGLEMAEEAQDWLHSLE